MLALLTGHPRQRLARLPEIPRSILGRITNGMLLNETQELLVKADVVNELGVKTRCQNMPPLARNDGSVGKSRQHAHAVATRFYHGSSDEHPAESRPRQVLD